MEADAPRPICRACRRNPVMGKGWYLRLDGIKTRRWSRRCGGCHKRKLMGNDTPAKSRHEYVAQVQIPVHQRKRDALIEQICVLQAEVKSLKAERKFIRLKIRRYKRAQAERKAGKKHCGSDKYKRHKKDHCESCGLIPEHRAVLEVDHIDGCKANGDPSNLQTLCANCHRVKTMLCGDHLTSMDGAPVSMQAHKDLFN